MEKKEEDSDESIMDVNEDSNEDDEVTEILEKDVEDSGSKRSPYAAVTVPKHLSKKMRKDELYKNPTAEELNDLKEAETMFHSTLFRLQIDELMSEVKLKTKRKDQIKKWITSFKTFVKNLPASETYEIHDLSWHCKDVRLPVKLQPKNKRGFFRFLPPLNVYEVGSFALDTLCAAEPVIDVAVEMPKACFQKTDYLNHLYYRKRAMYLTYLTQCLNSDMFKSLTFAYHNDNHLKPVLLLVPKEFGAKKLTIRVLLYPEEDTFKLSRFLPLVNNVRPSWFFHHEAQDENDGSENSAIPTPCYNSGILSELLLPNIMKFLKEQIVSQNVKDGIILLKVWCIQRDLYGDSCAVNGLVISMIVSYLLSMEYISPLMSSYQVFRNTLLRLKNEDWMKCGVALSDKRHKTQGKPMKLNPEDTNNLLHAFHQMFNAVLLDNSGFLNILYSCTKETYCRLRHEAELALKILDNTATDSFSLLFINKVPFCQKFDYLVRIDDVHALDMFCVRPEIRRKLLDYAGDIAKAAISEICKILQRGFYLDFEKESRVQLIDVEVSAACNWPVSKKAPDPNAKKHVIIGILANHHYAFKDIHKGPEYTMTDNSEIKEFRRFWGDKSQLRKFKDGSMYETVFWPNESFDDRRNILPQIVKYVLDRHASLDPEHILCRGTDIHSVLTLPKDLVPSTLQSYGTGEEMFISLIQAFGQLTRILRKLEGLPLNISSVQPTSAAFRFTEVFPPISQTRRTVKKLVVVKGNVMALKPNLFRPPQAVQPLNVVIHMESTGKWPDDVEALQRVKAALYIKMAKLLEEQCGITTKPTCNFIDVLKDGYIFRIEIACHKEITLLKQLKMPDGAVKIKDSKESRMLECTTEMLPKLSSILHGIHQQNNSFGTACRLAKRWISSQLLHGYIDDIVIDQLMASIYLCPEPFTLPSCPQVAFQRFLALLSTHNWGTAPLVINFNQELTGPEISEMISLFSFQKSTLSPMVIVTPLDRSGVAWTQNSPSPVIMKRLISLSKVSLGVLEEQLMQVAVSDFKKIFRPPLNPYDILIHLKSKHMHSQHLAIDIVGEVKPFRYTPYVKKKYEKMPVTDYDPVQLYLQELRENFDEFALFFCDPYGGEYIAVAWKPEAFTTRAFKVSRVNGCMVSNTSANGTVNIIPNIEVILEDFARLGDGLVDSIEKQTERWDAS